MMDKQVNINLIKRKTLPLVLFIAFTLVFWLFQPTIIVYGNSFGLEDLPRPFVSSGGFLNCSVVVASSVGHGPVGAAHTMDVMGAVKVAAQLGLKADGAMLNVTMDDYISTYDFKTLKVSIKDVTSNLIVVGGPGVNQVTWHYNNLKNASGARVLPVYFDKDQNGDYIRVASTGNTYRIEYAQGKIKADYGVILLFQDGGRFVMVLAGLGGHGTWASCRVVSSFESWNLHGCAAVVKYYDVDGDSLLDVISVVEEVPGKQYVISGSGPMLIGLISAPILASKWRYIKQKIAGRGRVWIWMLYLMLFSAVAAQVLLVFSSGVSNIEVCTFKDYSKPFVSSGGFLNCSVVVASSVGHGPVGAAHTMDVMGAVKLAAQLGLDASGGSLTSVLDDQISTYDGACVRLSPLGSNLLVVGGPGVNQVTWHYNNLKNASGARVLPVYFDKDQNGDYIRVASTGNTYRIEYAQGKIKADYGAIVLYYDAERGIWILIVAGLGGYGTLAAANLLANYWNWSLFGRAVVVKYADSDGDGSLDEASIVESVGYGKSVDVYWDAKCRENVKSIDWGMLSPGETKKVTVYLRNEGEVSIIPTLNVRNWNPAGASNYLKINWNYTGAAVKPGQMVAIAIILTVDSKINGITDFSVDIEIIPS